MTESSPPMATAEKLVLIAGASIDNLQNGAQAIEFNRISEPNRVLLLADLNKILTLTTKLRNKAFDMLDPVYDT